MFSVRIKSGTSGHYDRDNCDWLIAEIPSCHIPNVGDRLSFGDKSNHHPKDYLVTEVKRDYNFRTEKHPFEEWISVYVITM